MKAGKIFFIAVAALTAVLAACGTDDRGASQPEATETAAVPTPQGSEKVVVAATPTLPPLPTPPGKNLEPPYLNAHERLEKISKYVPGFGGMYHDSGRNALVVYLADESELEWAKEVIAAYYGEDMVSGTVISEQRKFAMSDLLKWYREAGNILAPLGGMLHSYIDDEDSRMVFGVNTVRAAERGRAALTETDIPADAVYFEVAPLAHIDDLPGLLRAPNGVEIGLEMPESVVAGETVIITLKLTNTGDRDLNLEHGLYDDLFVFGSDGIEVWSKLAGFGAIPDIGASTQLAAGESVRFETEWATVNNDREVVEPGEYKVQATFSFWEAGTPYRTTLADLVTEPQAITVLPRPG